MPFDREIASRIVEVGRLLYQRKLISATEGNISVRLESNQVMLTPSGFPKGRMRAEDLVIVDTAGRRIEGINPASSELAMHLHVYRLRPEINACVHSHAPYATSFAVAGVDLTCDLLPEIVLSVGAIALTEYAPPGTDAVGASLDPFLGESNAFLLRNHGLLTVGRNLEQAFYRHETVEHYARIVHLARQLGNVNAIPADDFKRLEQMRDSMERIDDHEKRGSKQ
ncbi:MAG: class II aldolase/adducin family protein [Candidatus Zixiibacteriota bacterium]|nr:MAG: class II aldolase/adducin family protein [candidate division Zixibacteria bacterium]